MNNDKTVGITIGGHFRDLFNAVVGVILDGLSMFDTAGSVESFRDRRTNPVQLEPDSQKDTPAHVPDNHQVARSSDGAQGDSTFARAASITNREEIRECIQRVVRDADQVFVGPSHGSATGNDQRVYRDILRRVNTEARVFVIHDVEPTSKRRVHMKKGLYELIRENVDRVREDSNPLTDVLVRGTDQVKEVLRTTPDEWDLVMEDVLNFFSEGEKGTIRAPQIRRKVYDHGEIVESVTEHVAGQSVPQRLRDGDPTLSSEEKAQIVTEIDRELRAIREAARRDIPSSSFQGIESAALDDDPEYPKRALVEEAQGAVQEAIQEDVPQIEGRLNSIYDRAFEVGYDLVLRKLDSCIQDIEAASSNGTVGETGSEGSLEEAAQQYVNGVSILQFVFSKVGLQTNGVGRAKQFHAACADTYRRRRRNRVLNLLNDLAVHMRGEISEESRGEESAASTFEPSDLPDELIEGITRAYLKATEESSHPEDALQSAVEDRLPRIIDTLVEQDIKEHGRFDLPFEVKRSRLGGEGVLIRSPFPEAIEAPEIFHIDAEHNHEKTTDGDVTIVIHYNVVKYLHDAPALRRMFRRIEEETRDSEDRRDHMVDASTVYPLPLFERPGDLGEEHMALLLAKAFFSTDTIHVHPDRVEVHPDSEKKTFPDFETFCDSLPPAWGYAIHERFWNRTFAPNRNACLSRIERAVEGSPRKRDVQRLERVEDFAGSRAFGAALETLAHRARVATQYWK